MGKEVLCPVCESHVFHEYGDYDICPICHWENDNFQNDDHDRWGGANHFSVNQAKIIYRLSLDQDKGAQLEWVLKKHNEIRANIAEWYRYADYKVFGDQIRKELCDELNRFMEEINGL